jgi:aspartate carbamoyltransferase catalytic subunit
MKRSIASVAGPRGSSRGTSAGEPVSWSRRHLLGLVGVSAGELRAVLGRARELAAAGGGESLKGRTVATLFFEDSTRTRTSFTLAGRRLGAEVVDLSAGASSVNKGETLIDTARTIRAMGVDALVVRTRQSGGAAAVAAALDASGRRCSVLNAGDGRHEHPTQGLLDLYTLAEAHGRLDRFDLSGLRVAIVGDVWSSRVARSAIAGVTALGGAVVVVGPAGMAPGSLSCLGCTVSRDLDAELGSADAVMMLRIQFERHEGAAAGEMDTRAAGGVSVREFRELYGLTAERASRMKAGAVVMHPGPINRGVELDGEVADGPRSVVLRQVSVGVPVRMAVLEGCVLAG